MVEEFPASAKIDDSHLLLMLLTFNKQLGAVGTFESLATIVNVSRQSDGDALNMLLKSHKYKFNGKFEL
jgi:hypothetical protein